MKKKPAPAPKKKDEEPPPELGAAPIEIWTPTAQGRPKLDIDLGLVEELAAIACTIDEIAAVLRVGARTLYRRMEDDAEFREAFERGKHAGRASLRRILFVSANRGNIAAAIFLSKQKEFLGYSDKVETSGPDGGPIEHKVTLTFVRPGESKPEVKKAG